MPLLPLTDGHMHYELSGREGAPVLLFSNSLGTDLAMWEPQVLALSKDFRILRYDTRGHGTSLVTEGPYTIDQLVGDVFALIDHLQMDQVYFCGLSMGGMIGMSLALRAAHRTRKVVLCSTAPKIGSVETWSARIEAVRKGGLAAVVDGVLQRWYTPDFRARSPQAIETTKQTILKTSPEGYVACCAAIRDADLREAISAIRTPTLIMNGAYDPVTTSADGHFMAARVPGAKFRELPAAHLCNIESSEAFTTELDTFLKT
jgi:3-oxoadipate enol-lactonase